MIYKEMRISIDMNTFIYITYILSINITKSKENNDKDDIEKIEDDSERLKGDKRIEKNEINRLKEFNYYCESEYKRFKQTDDNLKLQKIIVIHRHGDRSPLIIKGSQWKEKDCMECKTTEKTIANCAKSKCNEGDLSIKGYQQMVSLGNFIKKNYKELNFSKIGLRCTEVPRTQTSLHGVIKGLLGSNKVENVLIPPANEDSLLIPKNCEFINNIMERSIRDSFKDVVEKDTFYKNLKDYPPQRIADTYLTHFCNEIPLNSSILNLNDDIIYEYIETSFRLWNEQIKKFVKADKILEIMFGRFVNDLNKIFDNDNDIDIISVHDSSLSIILAGLGTDISKHPSYASAIFIEVWKDTKNNKGKEKAENNASEDKENKYIRIIYNDKLCKTTINANENIPLKKLYEYFKILAISNEEMIDKCDMVEYGKHHMENTLKIKDISEVKFSGDIRI